MLAYVFWHWKQAAVREEEYESAQRGFHAALGAAPPAGFHGSRSWAVAGCPWAANGEAAYEDWYLVNDSAGLDPLNDAAVSASRADPHHRAARLAAGGVAGLWRLRLPERPREDGPAPAVEYWFAKPAGLSYEHLWQLLGSVTDGAGARLWIRHMTLGPAPEFCLRSPGPVELPPPLHPLVSTLRPVWP
jgi:hypothetical protein